LGPWQSPAFERFEIAASAFGLLAMTPPKVNLDRIIARVQKFRNGGKMAWFLGGEVVF